MPLFTTDRERRLWGWTLAVAVAIYSTVAVAPSISVVLRNRERLTVAFVLALVLVVAMVVAHGLEIRPGGTEIAVAFGVAAAYSLMFLRMAIAEERGHLVEYGVLAVLIFAALEERKCFGSHVPAPALLAVLAATALGLLDEGIQGFIPNRVFDWRDVGFNAVAAAMAIAATLALAWARRRVRSPTR